MKEKIFVVRGDITRQEVDAIVNAANPTLLGGGGVDGSIHRVAGPGLLEECKDLGGCAVGQAKITSGHDLPATYVIHTVGPVWTNGENDEERLLAGCYRNSLALATRCFVRTIAFPSISTGAYRFPVQRAASIAIREILQFLRGEKTPISEVLIVCFDEKTQLAYSEALRDAP